MALAGWSPGRALGAHVHVQYSYKKKLLPKRFCLLTLSYLGRFCATATATRYLNRYHPAATPEEAGKEADKEGGHRGYSAMVLAEAGAVPPRPWSAGAGRNRTTPAHAW